MNDPQVLPHSTFTNFERFDLYAPYVKHLDIYGDYAYYTDISGWGVLSERAHLRPLLPNLLSITMRSAFSDPHGEEQLDWIADLVSPSLISFWSELVGYDELPARIPKVAVMVLLDSIIERCSTLERLAVYPKAGTHMCLDLPAAFGSLPFSYLRELSGSAALVGAGVLEVIGALPHLQTLSINAFNQYLPGLPLELAPMSFPALTYLSITTIYLDDALALANLRPMLRNLKTAELCIDPFAADEVPEDVIDAIYNMILQWLENTVCLRQFFLDLDPASNGYELLSFNHKPILMRMTELQLVVLSLIGADVDESIFHDPDLDWSHLKELHLPRQRASLNTLSRFAVIPNLEHLTIALRLSGGAVKHPDEIVPNYILRTLENSALCNSELCKPAEVDRIARYVQTKQAAHPS
jgi:hypothetical protein